MAKHDCICTKFASAIERRFNWLLDREDDHDYIAQEILNQQVSLPSLIFCCKIFF